jgi:2-C-methyl-D-erythritol 4-phosphate cytidylyltransferase
VVAAPPEHEEELERLVGAVAGPPDGPGAYHPIVISGGPTRSASVGMALAEVPSALEIVAVHDAARPLVTGEQVDALVEALVAHPDAAGVIAAAPVADTLKRAGDGGVITSTESRDGLWAAQTPQVFRADALREAHERGDDGATDDAMMVEAGGGEVLVQALGGPNVKVTTPEDLGVAEALLRARG